MLDKVYEVIKEYDICRSKDVIVAYSGGKDSFFACITLRELGYHVKPLIIDVGYNADWKEQTEILKKNCIEVAIIDSYIIANKFSEKIQHEIRDYYAMIVNNRNNSKTLCTPCYNAKVVALGKWCEQNGVDEIVFGHHGTDAVTSFLKSYFMYQDRFLLGNRSFDKENFNKTLLKFQYIFEEKKEEFLASDIYHEMITLLDRGLIGTDEAIRQKNDNFTIVRPLFRVMEPEILNIKKLNKLKFQPAECFRKNIRMQSFLTPREMIQKIINMPFVNMDVLESILKLIEEKLYPDGSTYCDARRNRTKILGEDYEKDLDICCKI